MRAFVSALALIAAGCATAPAGGNDPAAAQAFDAIETALLDAPVLRVDYEIAARGALEATLAGDLVVQKPALAALRADGAFAGNEVALRLVADGERLRGGTGSRRFEVPAPAELHQGLLVGLLRMGALHNLAMLSGGSPPEWTDGSVSERVVAHSFAFVDRERGEEGTNALSYLIDVNGAPAGEVTLWYDPERNLPLRRAQVVHFEFGDMQVEERYVIETGGIIGPCRFDAASIEAQD